MVEDACLAVDKRKAPCACRTPQAEVSPLPGGGGTFRVDVWALGGQHFRLGPFVVEDHARSVAHVLQAKARHLAGDAGWQEGLDLEPKWLQVVEGVSFEALLYDLGGQRVAEQPAAVAPALDLSPQPSASSVEQQQRSVAGSVTVPPEQPGPRPPEEGQLGRQPHGGTCAGPAAGPGAEGAAAGGSSAGQQAQPQQEQQATPQQQGEDGPGSVGVYFSERSSRWSAHLSIPGRGATSLLQGRSWPEAAVAHDLAACWVASLCGVERSLNAPAARWVVSSPFNEEGREGRLLAQLLCREEHVAALCKQG